MTAVAVIGAGTMGAGIARLLARAGHAVRVHDERPGAAERVSTEVPGASAAGSAAEAAQGAALCVEAVVEDLAVKQAVMAELAAATGPAAILATNTSALSVAAIADGVPEAARRRVAGAHFFNPPDLVPAVEVVRAPGTDPAVVERLAALLAAAGKTVAVVADTPGFVANRIQHAMIVEAWRCLEEGVATAADIDAIVSSSFGFRLFAFGPFRLGDLNGLDVYERVMRTLADALGERFEPPARLLELVGRGALGVKAGEGVFRYEGELAPAAVAERDRLLARLAAVREQELA